MTFRLANIDGRAALVDTDGGWHDLASASGGSLSSDPMAALADLPALHRVADDLQPGAASGSFADALTAGWVGAPVPRPASVFGVGLNYRTHAEESGMELPATPLVFAKFPTCVVGPTDDVRLNTAFGDHEVELVVVIGAGGRDIPKERAWDHVAGLTVGQDISDRVLQFAAKPPHFDLGKSRDTYGPIGPMVVSVDAVPNPDDLALRCEVDGVQYQADRTSNLIFDVPHLVSYLSGILTLQPGDLIFSGTPEGVGGSAGRFLQPGNVITSTIDGIGTITNRCVER